MQPLHPGDEVPAVFHTVFERLRREADGLFGAEGVRLVPVGHEARPFSELLRVGVCANGSDNPARHCFVKIFKPKPVADGVDQMRRRVVHDYETTLHIHEALSSFDHLDAVRPIVCYPEHLTVVTEEARGRTLGAELEARAAWLPSAAVRAELAETMTRVGQWVRALQAIDPVDEQVAIADLRDYIDLRLARLEAHGGTLVTAPVRADLLRHIDRLGAQVRPDERRSVLTHADMATGNVLVSDGRIVVLDFAMSARGTFVHDITRLHVQLDMLCGKPKFRPSVIDGLQRALLDGFDPTLSPEHPLFRLLSLLHRVNNLATLALQPAPFPSSLYNRRLRARHERWIAHELRAGVQTAGSR